MGIIHNQNRLEMTSKGLPRRNTHDNHQLTRRIIRGILLGQTVAPPQVDYPPSG